MEADTEAPKASGPASHGATGTLCGPQASLALGIPHGPQMATNLYVHSWREENLAFNAAPAASFFLNRAF